MHVRDPSVLKQAIVESGFSYRQIAEYAEIKARSMIGELANGNKRVISDRAAKLIAGRVGRPVEDLFSADVAPVDGHPGVVSAA